MSSHKRTIRFDLDPDLRKLHLERKSPFYKSAVTIQNDWLAAFGSHHLKLSLLPPFDLRLETDDEIGNTEIESQAEIDL